MSTMGGMRKKLSRYNEVKVNHIVEGRRAKLKLLDAQEDEIECGVVIAEERETPTADEISDVDQENAMKGEGES